MIHAERINSPSDTFDKAVNGNKKYSDYQTERYHNDIVEEYVFISPKQRKDDLEQVKNRRNLSD